MFAGQEEKNQQHYLSEGVDGIMRELVAAMWRKKPKDTLDFMLDWFKAERRGEHARVEYPKLEKYHGFLNMLDTYSYW